MTITCANCGDAITTDYGIQRAKSRGHGYCGQKCAADAIAKRALSRTGDRFWPMLNKSNDTGCWEFTGQLSPTGYGLFNWRSPGGKRPQPHRAHRVAWFLAHGELPPADMEVCHSCDNRACCNPQHLWLGTHQANMADMMRKGRWTPRDLPKGSDNHNAKLTESIVVEIRRSKLPARQLAEKFGVSKTSIKYARQGKTWRHVNG